MGMPEYSCLESFQSRGSCVSNVGTFFTESFPDTLSVIPEFVSQSCTCALYLKYLPQKYHSLYFLLHGCSAARNEKQILPAQIS